MANTPMSADRAEVILELMNEGGLEGISHDWQLRLREACNSVIQKETDIRELEAKIVRIRKEIDDIRDATLMVQHKLRRALDGILQGRIGEGKGYFKPRGDQQPEADRPSGDYGQGSEVVEGKLVPKRLTHMFDQNKSNPPC